MYYILDAIQMEHEQQNKYIGNNEGEKSTQILP